MDIVRREILPQIYLTCLQTDKFKTGCMSATLLTQLTRQDAASHALLPRVLRRGTSSSPDMTALQARLDGLYGASAEPWVRKLGEIQGLTFRATFGNGRFLPGGEDITDSLASLLGELWLSPNTRGGLFRPEYVEEEQQKLLERLDAVVNDKRLYAVRRMLELMCPYEDYGVGPNGSRASAEDIYYVNLSRRYKELLASSPLELFYCGSCEAEAVEDAFYNAFVTIPRGEPDWELGTDIRMNTVEEETRYFTEELDVSQGQLVLGFRLGQCMEDPDPAVLRVLNALYGGASSSKLFLNVREKLSLCYFASSSLDIHKGVMTVRSGIDFDKYDQALQEILAQWEEIRAGHITQEELHGAKIRLASSLRSLGDSPTALEDFYLDSCVAGFDGSPDELAALVEAVTLNEVVAAAQDVQLDAVYFLKGEAHG